MVSATSVFATDGPMTFTEGRDAAGRAAERDLVPLLATLVDAEDADVPDVVMPTGIHAAGHLDLDVAQIVEVIEIVEPLVDLLAMPMDPAFASEQKSSPGQQIMSVNVPMLGVARFSACKACQVSTRSICRTSPSTRFWSCVARSSPLDTRSARSASRSICASVRVAGRLAMRLDRNDHRAIARHLVRPRVVAVPGLEIRRLSGRHIDISERLVGGWPKKARTRLDLGEVELQRGIADVFPLRFHFLAERIDALGLPPGS